MPQPDLSLYYISMQNYNNFVAMVVIAAGVLTTFISHKRGKGINIPMKLWTILVLGIIVRLPLMLQDYWYDEAFTSAIAQTDTWSSFLTAVQGDVHPPLYYAITRAFTQVFGHNDIVMRMPALFSGVGMIVAMYHLAKQYAGARVGRYAALITAVLPAAVYYSTEARYPMFLAFMLAIAFIGIKQKKDWMVMLGLSAAALSHVNAWFYVLLMCFIYVMQRGKIKTIILPALSIAVWFPVALSQARDVSDGFWLMDTYPFLHLLEMTIGTKFPTVPQGLIILIISTTIIFVATWQWRKHMTLSWLALVAVVPLGMWLVGQFWHPIYLARTSLFSTFLLIIPIAWWLDKYASKWLVTLGSITILVGLSWMMFSGRAGPTGEALAMCDGYDTIYATNTHSAILAKHYTDANVIAWIDGNSTAQSLPLSSRKALFDDVGDLSSINSSRACFISQVSGWNRPAEMAHLEMIEALVADDSAIHDMEQSEFVYYLALYKEGEAER